jgi:hypothetical protein
LSQIALAPAHASAHPSSLRHRADPFAGWLVPIVSSYQLVAEGYAVVHGIFRKTIGN